MNSSRLLKYVLPCGLLILLVSPAAAQEDSNQDKDVTELKEVVVVGSRVPGRSVQDSPVPVDVLTGDNFRTYGARDMDSLLSATVPSYNVNQQPISDAATLVRPANLRGLPSDNLLILVNGKRRHRASVITFLGTGVSDGAHAPDLAVIPAIALDRVEVLRDGASAQYGSDAIAGVMNFVLKDAPDSGRVETRWGQFYEGDGDTFNIAGNLGVPLPLPLIESGFANFSFEYNEADPTDRSVQITAAQELIDAGNTDVRQPHAQVWGAPEFHYDYKLFGNLGLNLSKSVEIYAFGNYAQRKVEGGFFYRNPNARNGVFTNPNDKKSLLVADLSENGRGCPGVPTNDEADYSDVALPDHCFIFNEKFPGGFTPTFGGTVRDWSAAVGIRGDVSHDNVWLDDWHYDLSAVFGQHSTDFFMTNTVNPQLARLRTDVPTNYDVGADTERDSVFNLDLSRRLDTNVFHSPLNLALGLEYREEEFEREAGEKNSRFIDESEGGLVAQGFLIGSRGFPGYQPNAAGKTDRGSYAAYLDVEADVVKDLLIGVAGRYEEYETFGDTLNGKVTTRWQATSGMALRGSLSTGFRAPTVGQANVRNISTNIDEGQLVDEVTVPATLLEDGQPLKPEKSFNVSAGTVVNVGAFSVTIDYYRVKVQDRLGTTTQIAPSEADKESLKNEGIRDVRLVRYFTNAFDTTTQGVDIVATYPMEMFGGDTIFTFAGNWNQTRLTTEVDPLIIHPEKVRQIEEGLPKIRFSLTADHVQGPYRLLSRLYYYDVFVDYFSAGDGGPIDAESRWLVDLEASYTFKSGLTIASGAQNLFDTYPTEDQNAGLWRQIAGRKYPASSPYGFNGGFYYLRAAYAF